MKVEEKLNFILMLRYLIESGVPIIHSLSILEKTLSKYSHSIREMKRLINNGYPLFYSIQKSNLLSQLEISIIKIGENTENLAYALKKLEELLLKKKNLMGNLIRSLIFPFLFLFVLSFILVIFKNFIIPAFINLYVDMGIEIPMSFKVLGYLTSVFDIKLLSFLGLNIILISFIVYNLYRTNLKRWYRYIFMVPILGRIFYNAYVSLVLNLWAVALESGLPHSLTFRILQEETIEPFSSFFSFMYERASKGELYEVVNFGNAFNKMYISQINSALESGELPFTLRKMAELAEIEANTALDTFNKILEPVMATLAGIITASLCLSIFLPIIHIVRNI